jgi:ubiquinone/menaquinone biosynthesis C-methylase UbiE
VDTENIYRDRKLSEGYPSLGRLSPKVSNTKARDEAAENSRLRKLETYLDRLVRIDRSQRVLVLGCGPRPRVATMFASLGCQVTAVDPVPEFVEAAKDYVGETGSVIQGVAERIPLADGSQNIVAFEAVLEHVDSIQNSIAEIYRVLAPGGLLYLTTTIRTRFSATGKNGEYIVPFYNWFPKLVKEGYIFRHLHYDPRLANYSSRPAVHWLTYSRLCEYGRSAGFSGFYSSIDLMRAEDKAIRGSLIRRILLPSIQRNPWIRAAALTQVGGTIFMLKRTERAQAESESVRS